VAVWGCEGGFTAPSLRSLVSPGGENTWGSHGGTRVSGGAPWWPVGLHGGWEQWPCMGDMLGGVGGTQGLAAPRRLGLWGAWMRPTPLGDVSDGVDMSLDVEEHFVVARTQNCG